MKKRILTLLLVMGMALTAIGCGSDKTEDAGGTTPNENDTATEGEGYKVAFICKDNSDTFCLGVQEEFKKASEEYEDLYVVDYFDSQGKADTQNNQIETCTASGYDVIVFQQVDAQAPVSAVKAAIDKGIHVIVTTGHIEDDGASFYIDADPYQQGAVVAQYAVDNGYLDNSEVAILSGPTGNFHSENRIKAFADVIGTVEGSKLVASEVGEWSKSDAMTIAQNWLVAYPNLKVILSANDDMALGAIEAIEMSGKKGEIKVFGVDGTEAGLQAIKDKRLAGTVQQNPVAYATETADFAATLLEGGTKESINIDSTLITSDNIDGFIE